jgi:hypothetical protein
MVKALCHKQEGHGLKPDEENEFFFQITKSFRPQQALGFTRTLTEMSTRSRKVLFLGSRMRPGV